MCTSKQPFVREGSDAAVLSAFSSVLWGNFSSSDAPSLESFMLYFLNKNLYIVDKFLSFFLISMDAEVMVYIKIS